MLQLRRLALGARWRQALSQILWWPLLTLAVSLTCGTAVAGEVRSATLLGRHIVGYQGWFGCPDDGSGMGWQHWFRGRDATAENLRVDMWPDVSDYGADELCATSLRTGSGKPAAVFSSQNPKTVDRHLAMMERHEIDGLALQRFVSELASPPLLAARDRVLENVRAAAQRHARAWFVMYDISGSDEATWASALRADWDRLVARGVTQEPNYWHHNGRPVLAIWGLGFKDRPGSFEQALTLQRTLRMTGNGLTLVGGVPTGWRTLDQDSKSELGWAEVYKGFDVVSPWMVGRYRDAVSWAKRLQALVADAETLRSRHQLLLPVVFPGYSFANAQHDQRWFDRISRRCGTFYTMQVDGLRRTGVLSALYTAMFDEFDEATAILPVARGAAEAPREVATVTLDASDCTMVADGYLGLARDASLVLRASARTVRSSADDSHK